MNWYRWLYTNITPWIARPWTYFWRDLWVEAEWLMQLLWFSAGLLVGCFLGLRIACFIWLIYSIGYVNGHIHWGTKWIKGQRRSTDV